MQNFLFFYNLAVLFSGIVHLSPVYNEYDNRPNWTTRSLNAITHLLARLLVNLTTYVSY